MECAHSGDEQGKGGEYSELHDWGVRGGRWCLGEREVGRKRGSRRYLYETGVLFPPITHEMTRFGSRIKKHCGLDMGTWIRAHLHELHGGPASRWTRLVTVEAMLFPFVTRVPYTNTVALRVRCYWWSGSSRSDGDEDEIKRSRVGRDRSPHAGISFLPIPRHPSPLPATHSIWHTLLE